MDKTADQKREENRRLYPWVAEFIDELRKAGFENAKVVKITRTNTHNDNEKQDSLNSV